MNGLNGIAKHAVTFDRLINEGDLEINESCGTHHHIGNSEQLTPEKLEYIRRFYHSLFLPLSNAMANNPEATKRIYGRPLNYWSSAINERTEPRNHTNFINMQHERTIEFRCTKFVNAKQFMNAVHFNLDIVKTVINNFVKHFNEAPTDIRRYPTQTAYRKHKAQVTAQKLVALFEKYSNI